MKKLICFLLGHDWGWWALLNNGDFCQYLKCVRCGKFKGDGEKICNDWILG